MRKHYYIIGKVYGVQKLLKIKKKNNKSIAVVECIYCHKIKEILPYLLFNKKYNSCICQTKKVNGLSSSKIYSIYHNMKYRCYNKNHPEFHNYGGKGIKVDDQWLGNNGFNNFYDWSMQNGYKEGLSIDRINSERNYSPDNCRWIPLSENVSYSNRKQHRFANKGRYYGISPDEIYYEFDNASEFARTHNLKGDNVRQVANGQKKTHKGWRFGFLSEKCTDYRKHR